MDHLSTLYLVLNVDLKLFDVVRSYNFEKHLFSFLFLLPGSALLRLFYV